MSELSMRQALDAYADRHLSTTTDPWPAIRRAALRRPEGRINRWFRPASRRLAITTLLVVLAFSTAAAAGVAHFRQFRAWAPPRTMLERAGQLHTIDQARPIGGYTVTLRRAYADTNVILLETIVRDPAGQVLSNVRLTWHLTDARGTVLPQAFDSGTIQVDPGVTGQYAAFDAAALRGSPATVKLSLDLALGVAAAASQAGPVTVAAAATPGSGSGRAIPTPETGTSARPGVTPSAIFAFTVPFVAGAESRPQQTVRAMDFPLTLRRVIVTPTETRATVCYIPPVGTEQDHWIVVADEHGQSVASVEERGGAPEADPGAVGGERCGQLHLSSEGSTSGVRELRVKEVSWGPTGNETRLTGLWRFS